MQVKGRRSQAEADVSEPVPEAHALRIDQRKPRAIDEGEIAFDQVVDDVREELDRVGPVGVARGDDFALGLGEASLIGQTIAALLLDEHARTIGFRKLHGSIFAAAVDDDDFADLFRDPLQRSNDAALFI